MRIVTRLRIVSIATVTALAVLGVVVAWKLAEYDDAKADYALTDAIRLNFFERTSFRDQYFLFREDRLKIQWDESFAGTYQLLQEAAVQFRGEPFNEVLTRLQRYTDESAVIFHRIAANDQIPKTEANRGVHDELNKRLSSQLLLKAASIRTQIALLQSLSDQQVEQAYRNLIFAMGLFGAGVALLVLLTTFQLSRLIRRRLLPLHQGAAAIAHGDLTSRIQVGSGDEFDDLADDLNTMTDKLQSFTRQLEREIAEQKNTEAALHDSLAKLRAILSTSEVAIAWATEDGVIEYANPKFLSLFGYTIEETATIEQWYRHAYPDRAYRDKVVAEWNANLAQSLPTRRPLRPMEVDVTCRDGTVRHVLLMASWAGNRLLATFSDITVQQQAERDLRIAAVTFESQEGTIVTDAAGKILRVNTAFSRITGYSAEEVCGQSPQVLSSGRQDAAFYAAMWESLAKTGTWSGEIWNRRKNGESYPEWLTITAVKDSEGKATHYVGTFFDITSRKAAEDEIRNLAFYDPLTHLPNRRLLIDRLKRALVSSARSQRYGALLFIDLDNFKTLNDTLGHDVGDLLLQQVATRLTTCVREGDTVARLGGDEFIVMLEELSADPQESAAQTETVGEKILTVLNSPYRLGEQDYHNTPSIGVALFANRQESIEELLKRADLAMYRAKSEGRNTLRFFDPEMQALVSQRATLEAELRQALLLRQFVLYYQAQVDDVGRFIGVEALVRWQHPDRGLVSPMEFIPLAESNGLILPLGHWILESACQQLAAWAERPGMDHLFIAVNVSASQFLQADFVEQVFAVLDATGARPHQLKLELTESVLVDDVEDVIAKMTALKARGVGFSLDDFGTGYSSLSYLKRLPLDQLKIDQGFVRDILVDPNDAAIARMVISLAQSMGLSVIAEGVETQQQRDYLYQQGCHAFQGYLFSRPLPARDFENCASHEAQSASL